MLPHGRFLFFCAHPDDDIFSSGAFIYALTQQSNEVICVFLTSGAHGVLGNKSPEEKAKIRRDEALAACAILGASCTFLFNNQFLQNDAAEVEAIKHLLKEIKPEYVLFPQPQDAHPTHRIVHQLVGKALATVPVKEHWYYELWTPLEKPNYIFFFGEDMMLMKKKAMREHKSQLCRTDFETAMVGLNQYRGILGQELLTGLGSQASTQYGEAFFRIKGSFHMLHASR